VFSSPPDELPLRGAPAKAGMKIRRPIAKGYNSKSIHEGCRKTGTSKNVSVSGPVRLTLRSSAPLNRSFNIRNLFFHVLLPLLRVFMNCPW